MYNLLIPVPKAPLTGEEIFMFRSEQNPMNFYNLLLPRDEVRFSEIRNNELLPENFFQQVGGSGRRISANAFFFH